MPIYRVQLCGSNFLLDFEGRTRRMGFITSMVVTADSPEAAEREASLRATKKFKRVLNKADDPPTLQAEKVEELSPNPDGAPHKDTGFLFYREGKR